MTTVREHSAVGSGDATVKWTNILPGRVRRLRLLNGVLSRANSRPVSRCIVSEAKLRPRSQDGKWAVILRLLGARIDLSSDKVNERGREARTQDTKTSK